MPKFWSAVGKVLATIFSIFFVLTTVVSLFLGAINRRLFNAATYKNALAGQQIYSRLPGILAEQLVLTMKSGTAGNGGSQPGGGLPPFLQDLSVENWRSILTTLLPADILQPMTENILDQVSAYLNGMQDSVALNLAPIRDHLSGPAGPDAVMQLIRAQAPCTPEQLAQVLASLAGFQGLTLCRPPEDVLTQLAPAIQTALGQLSGQIPDHYVLVPPGSGQSGNALVSQVRLIRLILRLSSDIPLAFLLLVTLLAVRTSKSWLQWWGIPIFTTGLLNVILVVIASISFERIWLNNLASRIPAATSPGLITLLHDLARSILQSLLGGIFLGSILLGLLGLGMWIGSLFLQSDHNPDAPSAWVTPGS